MLMPLHGGLGAPVPREVAPKRVHLPSLWQTRGPPLSPLHAERLSPDRRQTSPDSKRAPPRRQSASLITRVWACCSVVGDGPLLYIMPQPVIQQDCPAPTSCRGRLGTLKQSSRSKALLTRTSARSALDLL